MPSRRRKKPPDDLLSFSLSVIWPDHTHSPDLPIPSHRPLPISRGLRIVVGFYPLLPHFPVRLNVAEATGSDFDIWVVHRPVLVYLHLSGYCSSVWRTPIGQVGSELCAVDTVSEMVTLQPSNRSRLDTVRYGMAISRCSPPPKSSQVWVLSSLSLWIYLIPPTLIEYCWRYGCLIDLWSRLIVASLTPSVIRMGRPCSGIDPHRWWPSSPYHVVFVISTPSLRFLVVIGFCWPLLDGVFLIMSSHPSSGFPVLGHDAGLDSTTVIDQAENRPGSLTSPTVISSEGDCSKSHAPSSAATFSEALILGVGCQDIPSASPSATHGHETASTPIQPAGMSSLCLLGKPWGDPIPLAIVMSKTRKDWGFIKGQLDYLELGNGWLLFRFSNMQDITLVWNGRPWHVSGLNLVLRRWEPFFDPYSATIQRIDQWVKITRLPLELWDCLLYTSPSPRD